MTFSVPDSLWQLYHEIADWMIDTDYIGKSCTIVYPPKRITCDNCVVPVGGGHNVHKHGGPAPFNFGNCPMCGGSGYSEQEITTNIRLRTYWNEKDWIKIAGSVRVPDADVMIIGYASDLIKLKRANEIKLLNEQIQTTWRMTLAGEPFFHGFGRNRYFMCFLKRV